MSVLMLADAVDIDNPVEHDLALVNGQLVLIDGEANEDDMPREVAQRIKCRLLFFKGEWFLDQREGFPYFEEVFIKNPDLNVLRAIFKEVIAKTRGVESVTSLSVALDGQRAFSVEFQAKLVTGQILDSAAFSPFIVRVR